MIGDCLYRIEPQVHDAAGEVLRLQIQYDGVDALFDAEETGASAGRVLAFFALLDRVDGQQGVRHFADSHQTQIGLGGNICAGSFLGSGN